MGNTFFSDLCFVQDNYNTTVSSTMFLDKIVEDWCNLFVMLAVPLVNMCLFYTVFMDSLIVCNKLMFVCSKLCLFLTQAKCTLFEYQRKYRFFSCHMVSLGRYVFLCSCFFSAETLMLLQILHISVCDWQNFTKLFAHYCW